MPRPLFRRSLWLSEVMWGLSISCMSPECDRCVLTYNIRGFLASSGTAYISSAVYVRNPNQTPSGPFWRKYPPVLNFSHFGRIPRNAYPVKIRISQILQNTDRDKAKSLGVWLCCALAYPGIVDHCGYLVGNISIDTAILRLRLSTPWNNIPPYLDSAYTHC